MESAKASRSERSWEDCLSAELKREFCRRERLAEGMRGNGITMVAELERDY